MSIVVTAVQRQSEMGHHFDSRFRDAGCGIRILGLQRWSERCDQDFRD